MQVAVLGKCAVREFLFHFHHRTFTKQLVYILFELGYLIFILQIEQHTLKWQCIIISLRWREVMRLLLISGLRCRLLNWYCWLLCLPRFNPIRLNTGENLLYTVLVPVSRALNIKRYSDYLPDLEFVKFGTSVTNELQHGSILKAPLARIRVEACAIYYYTSLDDGL